MVFHGQETELLPFFKKPEVSSTLLGSHSSKNEEFSGPHKNHRWGSRGKGWEFTRSLFKGWKFTLFLALMSSLVVLFFNVGLLIYASVNSQENGNTVIYHGDCHQTKRLNLAFHVLINALSTALLGASNFGMQCLCAPTRQNIDQSHEKGVYLDIGVPSAHNLSHVSRKRSILWRFLAISSIPFHLFYNSAIYTTTAVPVYDVFVGSGSLGQKEWSDVQLLNFTEKTAARPSTQSVPSDKTSRESESLFQLFHEAKKGALQNLSNDECMTNFGQTYQESYSKLLLVTQGSDANDSYIHVYTNPVYKSSGFNLKSIDPGFGPDIYGNESEKYSNIGLVESEPFTWMCPLEWLSCNIQDLPKIRFLAKNDSWYVDNLLNIGYGRESWPRFKVDYCLAMKMPSHCKVRYSPVFTILAVVANLVKTGILLFIWLGTSNVPLLTIGDAIASFLHLPDPHTHRACLLTADTVKSIDLDQPLHHPPVEALDRLGPMEFNRKRRYWASGVSKRRWAFCIFLWLVGAILCLAFLILILLQLKGTGFTPSQLQLQLKVVDPRLIITGAGLPSSSIVRAVLAANSPQLIFSFMYYSVNSVFTGMCIADEWARFSKSHKGLRVSNSPKDPQKSTYFLSVPYRYAVPLLVTSATLHWLISESLFVFAAESYDQKLERNPQGDVYNCAFSPVAIICAISVATFMFTALVGLGYRRLPSSMPIVGSNSFAIAAACHPNLKNKSPGNEQDRESEQEDDMSFLPVRWGALRGLGPIGHCSFTSKDVDPPEEGKKYQ